jgi:predicted PurR-regulated permease PerM
MNATIEPAIATPTAAIAAVQDDTQPAATSAPPLRANRQRNRLLGAIVVAIVAYTCVIAQAVIVPILVAILLGLMLAPAVRLLERWRVPRAFGALLAVVFTVTIAGGAFAMLATPARTWMARAPLALTHIESALRDLRKPLQAATSAAHDLGKLANLDGGQPAPVVNTSPGFFSQALVAAPGVLAGVIVVVFLLFLFLLHGDELLRKFVTLAPHLRAKRDLVGATRQAQHELSLYMITITLINMGLGLATAAALFALKIPDPLLWGGVAALMNFAPFVGPLLTSVALTVVGFGEFASPLSALAAPAAFLGLHLIESQLVTPHLVGRRLALDPVMVFLALIALGWMWGVAGLLLAVPLLSCAKIIAERAPDGNIVATLLSR